MQLLSSCIGILNNGIQRRVSEVIIKKNKLVTQFLECLWRSGYIHSYSHLDAKKVVVKLKYLNGYPVLVKCKSRSTISKPLSLDFFERVSYSSFSRFKDGVFLTSKGFLTLPETFKFNVSGKLICDLII